MSVVYLTLLPEVAAAQSSGGDLGASKLNGLLQAVIGLAVLFLIGIAIVGSVKWADGNQAGKGQVIGALAGAAFLSGVSTLVRGLAQ